MTANRRAALPAHAGRLSRRVRDLVRSVVRALLNPAMVVSFPVGNLLARQCARLRLVAGTRAEYMPGASRDPGAATPPVNPASEAERPSAGAGGVLRAAPLVGITYSRAGLGTGNEPRFLTVRVTAEFGPQAYAATFVALQLARSARLLDLVPARLLCADVFERLASSWTAPPDTVPRLGILLSFERWVMLRGTALAALQPLAARGIRIEVFYEEQAAGGHLDEWFAHGRVAHAVSAAVATLTARWQPSASWPIMIDTLTRLARAYTSATELPALLTEVAGLALSCGGADDAATIAREALYYLPETASATRSKALRELGAALIGQGQTAAGLVLLDQAIAMAATARAPAIGASALCQSGLCALNHGDYASAERRFRGAIALLSPMVRHPHLALAHHTTWRSP
jgi:hypothetical protein